MTIKDIQKSMTSDAIIIFRNNHFLGQDILEQENQILALTGFSGSAGTLIITRQKAFLFVDGRYEIQSQKQTNAKFVEVIVENAENNFQSWIKTNLYNANIEYNPWQISESLLQQIKKCLPKAQWLPKAQLMNTQRAEAFIQSIDYAGKSAEDKIAELAKKTASDNVAATFIGAADSVSWLTNLRSNALPDTPIIRAMALVTAEKAITLLLDNVDLPKECKFKQSSVMTLENVLQPFSGQKISADFNTTPAAIVDIFRNLGIEVVNKADFCAVTKAQKNPTELQGMKNSHIRDGVAICKFLSWFEDNYHAKTEIDVVNKLLSLRQEQSLFYSVSFETIAGSGENAAIIHYQPSASNCAKIKENSVLLLDSGGQYFDGTTDITRTISVGNPTPKMIEKFTIVLKAHIALASQIFPEHTSGTRLDAICRRIMWQFGLDYKHGTGHGVGCFLNVHEGPQNMGVSGNNYPLKPNMVVSIEPGYYEEGNFGIRIENLVYVTHADIDGYLKFEPLTMVPVDFRLIDKYLLTDEEIKWLNNYHHQVYQKIAPLLSRQERQWLEKACSPL